MLLLDTHVVIWLALDPVKVSPQASQAMKAARGEGESLSIAGITLFEIASLAARQRIQISLKPFLDEVESRFKVIPINRRIAAACVELPPSYPNDPMDRIIGATAILEGLDLVTADQRIRRSGAVGTVW